FSAADTVKQAKADSASTMPAIGIVTSLAVNGTKVRVALLGQGEIPYPSGGLTAGVTYWVNSVIAGALTTPAGAGSGTFAQVVGVARNATVLGPPIELKKM